MALGFLEVSLENYSDALEAVQPLLVRVEMMPKATEIIAASYIPDAVEAMVELDRLESAEQLVTTLERNGSRLQRDWMTAASSMPRPRRQDRPRRRRARRHGRRWPRPDRCCSSSTTRAPTSTPA